ncbi:MAG: M48 family metallopeptidase [Victivallales bacterium]|nr:M48 family metallopeptidase [Victivallales bacterium]MCF7888969.1 M48 family metallopeptidase [Victivallales bacterium]
MNRIYKLRIFWGFLILLILTGCSSAPYTGRNQFLITSENEEIILGNKAWKQIIDDSVICNNKEYNSSLKRVAENLIKKINEQNYNWSFLVIQSSQANAFCLPGGKIAVYSGLFKVLDNEGELAAIVGHEIAHALARHAGERMSQKYAAQVASLTLNEILVQQDIPVPVPWKSIFGIATNYGIILPYSRTHEYEADHIGMILMAKGGYNPHAAVSFWEKYSELSDYDFIAEFFSTHPMGEKRLKEIRKNLPIAMKYYDKAEVKHGIGKTYK